MAEQQTIQEEKSKLLEILDKVITNANSIIPDIHQYKIKLNMKNINPDTITEVKDELIGKGYETNITCEAKRRFFSTTYDFYISIRRNN